MNTMTTTELEAHAKQLADDAFWAWFRGDATHDKMLGAIAQHRAVRMENALHQARWPEEID